MALADRQPDAALARVRQELVLSPRSAPIHAPCWGACTWPGGRWTGPRQPSSRRSSSSPGSSRATVHHPPPRSGSARRLTSGWSRCPPHWITRTDERSWAPSAGSSSQRIGAARPILVIVSGPDHVDYDSDLEQSAARDRESEQSLAAPPILPCCVVLICGPYGGIIPP